MIRRIARTATGVVTLVGVATVSVVAIAGPASASGMCIMRDSGRDQCIEVAQNSVPVLSEDGFSVENRDW